MIRLQRRFEKTTEQQSTILIVDDEPENVALLDAMLSPNFTIQSAFSGEQALDLLRRDGIDLVLLDIMMPGISGLEVLEKIRSEERLKTLQVILVTALADKEHRIEGLEAGADDYIGKPFDVDELFVRVQTQLKLHHLRKQAIERDKLEKVNNGVLSAISRLVEMKDPYTAGHQRRVSQLAFAIANELHFPPGRANAVRTAGLIHDIGKLSVPTEILAKPGRLRPSELSVIRIHPEVGFEFLQPIEFEWPIAEVAYQHQERLNGTGYPQGLTSDQIYIETKIVSVADTVEAMSFPRPYHSIASIDRALTEINLHKEELYDGEVVDTCTMLFKEKGFSFDR